MNDPIIDEIYKMREKLASDHHYNLDSLYNALKEKRNIASPAKKKNQKAKQVSSTT
ncbi:MAG: hypothetical protein ACFCU1_12260 [Sumerlaeia bacterium]